MHLLAPFQDRSLSAKFSEPTSPPLEVLRPPDLGPLVPQIQGSSGFRQAGGELGSPLRLKAWLVRGVFDVTWRLALRGTLHRSLRPGADPGAF